MKNNINLHINWPTAAVFIAIIMLLGGLMMWSISAYYTNKRWTTLYTEVAKGCANPDNHLATITIALDHNQAWSCTPYYKQYRPIRAKKSKVGKARK